MTSIPDNNEPMKLDLEGILNSKNPVLRKALPGFVLNYLKKIVHQDELNAFLAQYGHLQDAALIEAGLKAFNIRYSAAGTENIPTSGRFIFVSNHPLGGLDGLVFINEISKRFHDIKFPVNDILLNIKNLSGIFLPINKHGSQSREAASKIEEAFASDSQILYFPAGLCSRKTRGEIKDLEWHKSFISKAIHHKRDIMPAFFSGRNSEFFYKLSNFRKLLGIKANIEMLYLADEMFRQKDKEIRLTFGKRIGWETFDRSRSVQDWTEWVRERCYELESIST